MVQKKKNFSIKPPLPRVVPTNCLESLNGGWDRFTNATGLTAGEGLPWLSSTVFPPVRRRTLCRRRAQPCCWPATATTRPQTTTPSRGRRSCVWCPPLPSSRIFDAEYARSLRRVAVVVVRFFARARDCVSVCVCVCEDSARPSVRSDVLFTCVFYTYMYVYDFILRFFLIVVLGSSSSAVNTVRTTFKSVTVVRFPPTAPRSHKRALVRCDAVQGRAKMTAVIYPVSPTVITHRRRRIIYYLLLSNGYCYPHHVRKPHSSSFSSPRHRSRTYK